jgi:DNA-binding NtrC family response regulator
MSESLTPLSDARFRDSMRDEFFQLLSSLVIHVPPLRERMDDFLLIAQDMLERDNRDRESQVAGFAEEVWSLFRRYRWPGNLQELQAVVQEARARCTGKLIVPDDLPSRFRMGQEAQRVSPSPPLEMVSLKQRLAEVERAHIRHALELSGYNKSQAAEQLGITRPKLYRRMQELGISDSTDET